MLMYYDQGRFPSTNTKLPNWFHSAVKCIFIHRYTGTYYTLFMPLLLFYYVSQSVYLSILYTWWELCYFNVILHNLLHFYWSWLFFVNHYRISIINWIFTFTTKWVYFQAATQFFFYSFVDFRRLCCVFALKIINL